MAEDAERAPPPGDRDVRHPRFIIRSHDRYYMTTELLEYDPAKAKTTQEEDGVRRVADEFDRRLHTGAHRDAVEYGSGIPIAMQQTKS